MNGSDDPVEVMCEFLQKSIERAVCGASAALPGDAFREILKLATRQKTFAVLGLDHLLEKSHLYKVKLSGDEWRSLLLQAIKAHPRDRRHKLRLRREPGRPKTIKKALAAVRAVRLRK